MEKERENGTCDKKIRCSMRLRLMHFDNCTIGSNAQKISATKGLGHLRYGFCVPNREGWFEYSWCAGLHFPT